MKNLHLYLQLRQEAVKEQKEFNERHGVVPQKLRRRKSVYIERPVLDSDAEDNEEKPSTPSKKRKQSQTNGNASGDDEPPTKKTTNRRRAQIKLPAKRPKTKAQKAAAVSQFNRLFGI